MLNVTYQSAIARAWYVAQHAIVFQWFAIAQDALRQNRAVVIDNHEVWRVQTFGLMNQHITACVIHIVSHYEAAWDCCIFASVEGFNQLSRFRARCSAHV